MDCTTQVLLSDRVRLVRTNLITQPTPFVGLIDVRKRTKTYAVRQKSLTVGFIGTTKGIDVRNPQQLASKLVRYENDNVTNIRRARPEEAATLTNIALEAKRHWGYPEHWIKHWEADLTISPEFVVEHEVYVACSDEAPVGFYALCLEKDNAELEHMWVLPAHIGSGLGKELFLDAMERASRMRVKEVGITADPNAAGFYEHMGAQRVGDLTSEIDGTPRKLPRLKIEP